MAKNGTEFCYANARNYIGTLSCSCTGSLPDPPTGPPAVPTIEPITATIPNSTIIEPTISSGNGSDTGLIVGLCLGVAAVLVIIAVVIYWYRKRETEKDDKSNKDGARNENGKSDPMADLVYTPELEVPEASETWFSGNQHKASNPTGVHLPPTQTSVDQSINGVTNNY